MNQSDSQLHIFFCRLVSHPWLRTRRKKKTGLSTRKRGHRWQRTNGDVSQVVLKNRGLVLAVASCGDKSCTVSAKYGPTVVVVDSWSIPRAENSRAISLNKRHNSFVWNAAVPEGISLNGIWRWWECMLTEVHACQCLLCSPMHVSKK